MIIARTLNIFRQSMPVVLTVAGCMCAAGAINGRQTGMAGEERHTVKYPAVKWELLPADGETGKAVERITVTQPDSIAKLCFNQLPRPMRALTQGDTLTEINAGYYAITSSGFGKPDTVVVDIELDWALRAVSESPEAFHILTKSGRVLPVEYAGMDMNDAAMADSGWREWTVSADSIFRLNEQLKTGRSAEWKDVIPSLKKVTEIPGVCRRGVRCETVVVADRAPEYYKIVLSPELIRIEGGSEKALKMARRMVDRQLFDSRDEIPCGEIEDWPDFPHRGVMIDVARNFLRPADMKILTELMADYRLNRLHFHITDDEGWRLEIPGLPELTDVGSRRGYTLDDRDFLAQIFSGPGNPDDTTGTANGFYTREEFIDFLKHCDSLGIEVIPEIESPGHARAAIKSMEARWRRTGDDTYRLIIPGDTSRYTSAQLYHDNLMNPAAPGTYRFIAKVVDEIAGMYREAGVPLPGIHLGGDEVPEGAWDGSPEAMAMARERGVTGRHGLQGEYVKEIARIMKERGIPLYGWQDICMDYGDEFNGEVAPAVGGVNCWVSGLDKENNVAVKSVRNGYPVILSNVDYFYLDMLYSPNPYERGLYWGGFVDELQTLSGYPDKLCPPEMGTPGEIIGVQGQLFSETVRNREMAENLIFPKVAGIAERGWNRNATYSREDFNMLMGEKELPRLSRLGVAFHMRQPGILVEDGTVKMNTPYPDSEIRYTTDGSVPTAESEIYTVPLRVDEKMKMVRAILVKDGRASAETRAAIR